MKSKHNIEFFNEKEEPLNIIFLDIVYVLLEVNDGDDNSKAYEENLSFIQSKLGDKYKELDLYTIGATLNFSRYAVDNLKTLCAKANAKIVCTDWRIKGDKKASLEQLKSLFKLWDLDDLIIDQTPFVLNEDNIWHGNTALDITAWLKQTKNKLNSYVILSYDRGHGSLSEAFPNNFISTRDRCLFTEEHLEKALSLIRIQLCNIISGIYRK